MYMSFNSGYILAHGAALFGPPQCPEIYGVHAYPHPEDCGSFFLCTNGTLTYEHCENGLLFDGHGNIHHHCNYNWAVDCGQRKPDCMYKFMSNLYLILPYE